jgi:hypothetical protein
MVVTVASGALLGVTYAWGKNGDPDSFRSQTNVFQGALWGVLLSSAFGMGAFMVWR